MAQTHAPGQIVVLNGAPRSGKTSIANVIQDTFDGVWMNLGVDGFMRMTPARYMPGMGLRPGGERLDIEPLVQILYRALYESIAAHSHLGLNVVVDVGHHDAYAVPRDILPDCARILSGLPVLFVGVRCPLETIMERRRHTAGRLTGAPSRAFVAAGSPHPGYLRPASRYVGARPESLRGGYSPASRPRPTTLSLPATCGYGESRLRCVDRPPPRRRR